MQNPNQRTMNPGFRGKLEAVLCLLDHPDQVLNHPRMSDDEKRALLAAWASDANTVENEPWMRRLDNGTLIPLSDILRALESLDGRTSKGRQRAASPMSSPWPRTFRGRGLLGAWRRRSPGSDDDDPPPCPASIEPRPKSPGGMSVSAVAEAAYA